MHSGLTTAIKKIELFGGEETGKQAERPLILQGDGEIITREQRAAHRGRGDHKEHQNRTEEARRAQI